MKEDQKVTGCGWDSVARSQRTGLVRNAGRRGGEYGSTDDVDSNNTSGSKTSPFPFRVAEPRPFPFGSVLILAICMTLNVYTLVNLFPYVGMMVKGLLGLDTTNEVGFYAGYVASSFTFGRFLSGYLWGSLTDRIGRKPVIVIGLLSIATCSIVFGVSGTYSMALTSRFILGLTNPIMPALRTTVSEVCGPEHVVVGMTYLSTVSWLRPIASELQSSNTALSAAAYFAGVKAISMVIGTGVGGLLAQPALHFPGVFSPTGLFDRYPFLLPNLVGAVMSFLSLLLVVLFLPETKDYAKRPRDIWQEDDCSPEEYQQLLDDDDIYSQVEDEATLEEGAAPALSRFQLDAHVLSSAGKKVDGSSSGSDTSVGATEELSASEGGREEREQREPGLLGSDGLLAVPHVNIVLLLGCVVSIVSIGFDEVYPLFALSTPDVGGLGWSTMQIGKVLVATGVLMAICQLFVFPRFIKIVGIMTWQRLGCGVGVVAFVAVPAVKTLSWGHNSLFVVSVLVNAIAISCIQAVNLALEIGSTTLVSANMRGKLGGLFNTAESLGRFLGPAGYSIAYAWSVSSKLQGYGGWLDYHFVFYASAAVLAMVAKLSWGTLTIDNLMKPERAGR